jgi:TolB protein
MAVADGEMHTIRVDGTDLRRPTRSPGNDAHTGWSPDGHWIAFAARGGVKARHLFIPIIRSRTVDLYVMRADGSDVMRLTDDQFEEGTPAWLPIRRGR